MKKLIPLIFFSLAIAAAFSTHATSHSNKKLTSIQGYVKLNVSGTICNTSVWCSDNPGPLCMVGTTQIWGKDSSGKCVVELYRDTR